MSNLLNNALVELNPMQEKAVTAPFGNLLVLAGAGSGKTRVLIHRIGWMITENQISLNQILAVTFANKAANEMRTRLATLLNQGTRALWVGTFHGIAHKFLRLHFKQANLHSEFQVLDSADQLNLIRKLLKQKQISEDMLEPKAVQSFINKKKDAGVRANSLNTHIGYQDQHFKELYLAYEQACQQAGVVDFAELLLKSYELLSQNPELLAHYQARFQHILVDEFQDTNTIQYKWLSLLAAKARSITVVGDDDQSIYGWRGAKIENIHQFSKDFHNTTVIRLEQNYRSTACILSAANSVIMNNTTRMSKKLWTELEKGDPITLYGALNEEDEAVYLVRQLQNLVKTQAFDLDDMAILYRSNAQSRVLEEALVRANVPYRIYGGVRFFERAEIKDALAYLRLALNSEDNATFERIINVPPRGIGEKSLEKLVSLAKQANLSYFDAATNLVQAEIFTGKAAGGLKEFISQIQQLHTLIQAQAPLGKVIEQVIEKSSLLSYFENQRGEKAQSRAENLKELISAATDFSAQIAEEENMPAIQAFLAHTALEAGDRETSETTQQACVQLMTIHAAKGLEFSVVFLSGIEEGLFPSYFSKETPEGIEEERRLMYVGITRAMQKLYLTYARKRRLFGRDEMRRASRFIGEIPDKLIKDESKKIMINLPYRLQQTVLHTKTPAAAKKATANKTVGGFSLGQSVRHAKFGVGVILDIEGDGEKARLHIAFEKAGSKWLVLGFAKLEALP